MLLSWGFYPATRPTDWAFNQHVHALPPLPYDALVAAAAQLLLLQATDNNSSNGSSDGKQLLEAAMQGRLLAVVGSLPLQLPPELLLLQAAGSAAAAAAAADTSYVPYAHAAAVALKYGLRENVLEPLEAADGNTEVPAIAAERFKVPSSQQRELAQVRCCCWDAAAAAAAANTPRIQRAYVAFCKDFAFANVRHRHSAAARMCVAAVDGSCITHFHVHCSTVRS
jgi:hypothetical protein